MADHTSLDILIPVSLDSLTSTKEEVLNGIREQHRRYGFTRFMLLFPDKGWRSSLVPPDDDFLLSKARLFREIAAELAPEGIHCGWWITLTIKSGPVPQWTRLIHADGSPHPFANCPLDDGFSAWFTRMVAMVASVAKPEFIITEDDFSLHGGCFCPRHLEEFSHREGQTWTRESLLRAMAENSPEACGLSRRWAALRRDTLAAFATRIRQALDRESPEIPIGTCQSGGWNGDGEATEAVTAALAGPRHRPFTRLFGTFYGGEDLLALPEVLFHPLYFKEHLPPHFICLHETDTFPHTRFFTSASCIRVMMSTVFSQGYDGSVFQTQQLLDDPNEEPAYGEMFAAERPRFQAMHEAARQCRLDGVHVPYIPEYHDASSWLRCLSHFGIPYTTRDAAVTALDGGDACYLPDDKLRELFAKGLIIDGEAAKKLFDRGYADYMGVDVTADAVQGREQYDLAGREIIQDGFASDSTGRMMHRPGFYAPHGNGKSWNLLPHDGCEVLTRLVTFQNRELGVGMTRFVNKLGGHVVVMGMGTRGNQSSSLFNYRRQKLLQEQLVWCGGSAVFAKGAPKIYVVMNRANAPDTAGFFGMLTLTNLNPDPLTGIELFLPDDWRDVKTIHLLTADGHWQNIPFILKPDGISLPALPLDYAKPQVLLFC